jgi:hypothetical protein
MSAVKDFKCNNCGAPLPIPKNSKGHVKCPSCKTECVIEGLIKNAEMADKENINSGFPLIAPPAALHHKLVSLLIEAPNMPLDIFEKSEVIREEHYCVPSYIFYCTGTASYTYEVCEIREQIVVRDNGEKSWEETRRHEDWKHMSGTVNATETLFASGNRQAAPQVKELYMHLEPKKLVDFDELDFPHDVVTYDYNLPQSASFNEHIKPYMESLLMKKAEEALEDKETRGLSIGGCRIDKDEPVRVFLGLYRIVFKYGDKEYSVWMTGDGAEALIEELPADMERQKTLDEVKKAKEESTAALAVPKTGCLTFFLVIGILCAAFSFFITLGVFATDGPAAGMSFVLIALSFVAVSIICGVFRSKKWKPYKTQRVEIEEKYQKEMAELEAQKSNVVQQFKEQKKALHGIYEEVTGDASAFPA